MKSTLIFILSILACNIYSQKLEIEIINIDYSKGGNIKLAIFNQKDGFLKTKSSLRKYAADVSSAKHTVTFNSLPSGNYSISVFHDENANNELDTNILFIPKEGYGFSNNPKFYGPPNWEKSHFYYNGEDQKIIIELGY